MSKQQSDQEFSIFGKSDQDADYIRIIEGRLDSLGWKVALISIVLPCLIAIVVVMGYFSIRQKVTEFQDSGAATVRKLSNSMEERMAALQKSHDALSGRVEQAARAIKKNSGLLARAQRDIRSVGAEGRKIAKNVGAVKKDVGRLFNDVGKLSNDVGRLSKDLALLDGRVNKLQNAVDGLRAQLDGLDKEKAGRDELERVLSNNTQTYKKELDAAVKELGIKIKALEKRLQDLAKVQSSLAEHALSGKNVAPGVAKQGDIVEEPLPQ